MFALKLVPLRPPPSSKIFTASASHSFSTSTTIQYRRCYPCRTLQPPLLLPPDLIDISQKKRVAVSVKDCRLKVSKVSLIYCYQPNYLRAPFPPNTCGFLYYHHVPDTPLASAEIRFRVTTLDDPTNFSAGTDLLTPRFIPWSINTLALSRPSNAPLKELLLREGFADPQALNRVTSGRHSEQTLFYLEQPFIFDLQSKSMLLGIASPSAFGLVMLARVVRDQRSGALRHPYRGRILLRFERSTLPKHAHDRIVVLRVLKVLEPITPVEPDYDMFTPPPKEGDFLRTNSRNLVLSINLDACGKWWKDLGLLVP
ncbi:hypothetical protein H0H92_013882, partial [Tricholoma furcatifolium]